MLLLTLSLTLACGGKKNDATTPDVAADVAQVQAQVEAAQAEADADADPIAPMASSEGYAVYRALSIRDPQPDCAEIEAMTSTPQQTLLEVIDRATLPPWVPMRAALCLIQGHGADIQAELLDWVGSSDTRGLAILVFDQIDALPEDVALVVAREALIGPWEDDAASRLAKSSNPALVALAEGAQQ